MILDSHPCSLLAQRTCGHNIRDSISDNALDELMVKDFLPGLASFSGVSNHHIQGLLRQTYTHPCYIEAPIVQGKIGDAGKTHPFLANHHFRPDLNTGKLDVSKL
ncbi:hypothetical protein D3C86_1693920 [compost metagenome]